MSSEKEINWDERESSSVFHPLDQLSSAIDKMEINDPQLPARTQLKPRMAQSPTDNVTVNFIFSCQQDSPDEGVPPEQRNLSDALDVPSIKLARRPSKRNSVPVEPEIKEFTGSEGPSTRMVPTLRSDFTLSQFHWIKTIGTGTFGRVVLCEDSLTTASLSTSPSNSRFYAMKILRISDIFRLKQVEHIKDEKKILKGLDHPFIVKMIWSYHDSTNLYMLLEYAAGGELFTYLRSVGRFTVPTAQFYAAEIILALEYLHCKSPSIIYRDLKPENLIFSQDGHIKITDFGFAKELTDRTWTLCGTPEYLAPEIIQSRGYNRAVDYWAFGILLYEMLAGHPPFFSENPIEIYQKILDAKIRWPKQFDLVAKDLIKKLLVADRTKRLGNMKNGVQDIKLHRFFKSLNWSSCLNKEIQPPYLPRVSHAGDSSNFDDYSEEWMEEDGPDATAREEQVHVFCDF
ncbi:Protein kinase DC2 [Hypsibius exemplaris]|uniref:Protein kinase DC2 n=1 Tax=Hypsibius exemplaris TaxID=2072580 RepID=A0A1W0XEK8_HYPEX|nr:Protein kinase DC2 [Hypsibius exemplaris]